MAERCSACEEERAELAGACRGVIVARNFADLKVSNVFVDEAWSYQKFEIACSIHSNDLSQWPTPVATVFASVTYAITGTLQIALKCRL